MKTKASPLLSRPELAPAAEMFTQACLASRCWDSLVEFGVRQYGAPRGNHTSGCFNPDFPEWLKDSLRDLAAWVAKHSEAGHALRPRGVRASTMRELASAVARRDGSGYYGPKA